MNLKFGISEKKEKELFEKMKKLGIKEKDLIEKFILSSGKGGQKRNKTSTCVYLKHIPTGIEVKCGKTRSQSLNRFFARRILVEKLEEKILGKESSSYKKIFKKIKQKKKRERRTREKYQEVIPHG